MENTDKETHKQIPLFIEHARQGTYFTIPFTMPEDIESLTITYQYQRQQESQTRLEYGTFTSRQGINTIDLGLIAPDGTQVGVSGSARSSIFLSETRATPGYHPHKLVPGEWKILVGAYKVADQGVEVSYELTFAHKYLRWYKGDLHTHTDASDGVFSRDELVRHAFQNRLDYLAITDHNQMPPGQALLQYPDITLIRGMEWTHFRGHANFLGADEAYVEPFFANTMDEIRARFESAHEHGALIVICHPRDGVNPFEFDIEQLPFDCLEIWKGLILEYNPIAIAWWHNMLVAGKKIPVCGGSDYHEDTLNRFPGGPTTCVYAMSNSPADILSALKHGHDFVTYAPYGPMLEMTAGDAIMGDSVSYSHVNQLEVHAYDLAGGDVVQVITGKETAPLIKAATPGELRGIYKMNSPGFARIEILRTLHPSLPLMPVLISNPIYFDV